MADNTEKSAICGDGQPFAAVGNGPKIVAGTTIARRDYGILLRGSSGCGKSDLALRALSAPLVLPGERSARAFELVSDDQTVLTSDGGTLIASAPAALRSKLEVRGIGIVSVPCPAGVPLALIADLTHDPIERMPDDPAAPETLFGLPFELVRIAPFESSAPIKLALALARAVRRLPGKVDLA